MKISAVIITLNEEDKLPDCLKSLDWVDEIVILDSCSVDRTVEIGKLANAKVYQQSEWLGFGNQKNKVMDYATGDWIFSIDADERVSPELAAEIRSVLERKNDIVGMVMPRLSKYCGRYMRHSGWWPDYVLRLCKKGAGKFSDDLVHEKLHVNGKVEKLSNPLIHETFDNFEQVLNKVNKYSTLGAEQLVLRGKKGGVTSGILHGINAFIKTYFLKAGFLDGSHGLMLAISNAEGAYYKYIKLMILRKREK